MNPIRFLAGALAVACLSLLSGCASVDPVSRGDDNAVNKVPALAPGASQVDKLPVPAENCYIDLSHWSKETLRRYRNSTIVVHATINEDGTPEDISIAKSDDEDIAKEVAEQFKNWRFKPALKDGQPVRCTVNLPVELHSNEPADHPPVLLRQY